MGDGRDTTDPDEAERIVLEWLDARERGVAADPEELIRLHPKLAEALRERLAAIELVDAAFDVPDVAPPPKRIGRYRLLEKLGAGGMGTVFLAEDAEGHRVALKVLHAHLLEREGFFKRFLREAELGRQVDDEHVVRTLDADAVSSGGRTFHFLVMEYVEGRTLCDLLDDMGRVPEALLREVAKQVAAGLAAIHAAGIVHRDLKPENVVVTKDHDVRIMDLGVAKVVEASQALTEEGRFAGTLRYAAPEQFKGAREVTAAADLYALGVLLFELATGAPPFADDDAAALIRAQIETVPRRITDIEPDLSPFLASVVSTLLAKDPSRRFASAAALREVLDAGESHAWWTGCLQSLATEGARIPRVPVRRETTLFGRDADLAALRTAFDRAQRGDGNTVLLAGEAGIGKSRLVDAFLATLDASLVHVLYGSYPPSGGMGALSDAVIATFGAASLEDAIRPYMVPAPGLARGLAATLLHTGEDALQGDAIHAALVHLMRGLAAERPLVLVADDLHFADADSRKVLLSLARAVEGHRVLLVLTTRPGLAEDEFLHFRRLESFACVSLGRLSPREVVELLQDAFKSASLADKLGARIALASDGVPFFVFEMIGGLREGQFVTQLPDGSHVETKAVDRIEVPPAIKDLVKARLRGLSKEERTLLDVGAVQGFEFDADLVARVVERRKFAVLRDLAEIERRSGVVRASGALCRFDHHQIQEVLFATLPEVFRVECHAQIAEALEVREGAASEDPKSLDGGVAVALAEHFLRGGEGPRALRYLDAALTHLEKGYRNDAAIALAERSLGAPGLVEGRARCELLLRRVHILKVLGRGDALRAAIEEARARADAEGDLGTRARARCELGWLLSTMSRNEQAQAVLDEGLTLARAAGDRKAEASVIWTLGMVFRSLGRYAEAREHFERTLALAQAIGDRRTEALATGGLGNVFRSLGRFAEAQEHQERYLAISREIGDRLGEANALMNLGNVLHSLRRDAEAREHQERSLALAREFGDRACESHATGNLGNVFGSLGRHAESREHQERCLALARELGDRTGEAVALVNLGPTHLVLGRPGPARESLDASLALCREIGARYVEGYALLHLGRVADAEGDAATASRLVEESLALRRRIHAAQGVVETLIELGDLRHRDGDAQGARTALDEAAALARERGLAPQAVLAATLLACLPGGDAAAAAAALAAAGESADTARVRFLLWQATRDRAHLVEAKRRLDFLVEHAPPDCRESMLANVRLHREIAEAARGAAV